MLIYRRTSILESRAQTLVNTVNCVGVMGKGLAHAFKEREPTMFEAYKRICDDKLLEPGKLWLWRGSPNWVLNFPTKIHWRDPSQLEWVEAGLAKFASAYAAQGISEVSFPKLGCGNGNLDWDDVRPLMEAYLGDLPIKVYIHDFTKDVGLPEHLEAIAETARRGTAGEPSFEAFLSSLRDVVKIGGEQMLELGSGEAFRVSLVGDDAIAIDAPRGHWEIEEDALRGVWLELQSGIVTNKSAGWTERDAGPQIVSLLSLLPGVRPIEIQRRGAANAELAVEREPLPHPFASVFPKPSQAAFAWH